MLGRRTNLSLTAAAGLLLVGSSLACQPTSTAPAAPTPVEIDGPHARRLLLAKYRDLFRGTYYRLDNEYHEYPPLSEADFKHVQLKGDAWEVRCEPLIGYTVTGRVAKTGEWIDVEQVGFANQ